MTVFSQITWTKMPLVCYCYQRNMQRCLCGSGWQLSYD